MVFGMFLLQKNGIKIALYSYEGFNGHLQITK